MMILSNDYRADCCLKSDLFYVRDRLGTCSWLQESRQLRFLGGGGYKHQRTRIINPLTTSNEHAFDLVGLVWTG